MPIKKLTTLFLVTAVLVFHSIVPASVFAEDGLLERSRQARTQYSEVEMALLNEKADLIRDNYEGISPVSIDRIINKKMNFKFDTPPVIKDGRTLVPVRTISEAFEASVHWNPEERSVEVRKGGTQIVIHVDEVLVSVDGVLSRIDVPAIILNGRTMVPLRFICESLGLTIVYHEKYGIVEMLE